MAPFIIDCVSHTITNRLFHRSIVYSLETHETEAMPLPKLDWDAICACFMGILMHMSKDFLSPT